MRLIQILLAICIVWGVAQAQIHYWVDKKGIQHYSCDPPPNKNAAKDYQVFATFDNAPKRVKATNNRSTPNQTSNNEYPDVVLFTTVWCGYCKQAKMWLDTHEIPYSNYDIERSSDARAEFNQLGGKGVPLILVGEHRMNGWGEASMKKFFWG